MPGRTIILVEDGVVQSIFSSDPAQQFEVVNRDTVAEGDDSGELESRHGIYTEEVLASPLEEAIPVLDECQADLAGEVERLNQLKLRTLGIVGVPAGATG